MHTVLVKKALALIYTPALKTGVKILGNDSNVFGDDKRNRICRVNSVIV